MELKIQEENFVSDIVRADYRTADVFRKYGINYCCGGKWPLQVLCANQGLAATAVVDDLNNHIEKQRLQPAIEGYENWNISFLLDFLQNVNHAWFATALPILIEVTAEFVGKHTKKFAQLEPLPALLNRFEQHFMQAVQQDVQVFFPYMRQLEHTLESRESYGLMFVKTLKKPLHEQMLNEKGKIAAYLKEARMITNNYTLPEAPCTSHHVAFMKLRELDDALVLLEHMKYDTLYNKAIHVEQELLQSGD